MKNAETGMIIKNTTAEDKLFEEIYTKLIIGTVYLLNLQSTDDVATRTAATSRPLEERGESLFA